MLIQTGQNTQCTTFDEFVFGILTSVFLVLVVLNVTHGLEG